MPLARNSTSEALVVKDNNNPVSAFLKAASKIEANEIRATVGSFIFVVVLMSAYYILRPVRDAMASDWTDVEVSWLWTLNFFISTAVVALYGVAVSRIRFTFLVPAMYGIFALTFAIFYISASASTDRTFTFPYFGVSCRICSIRSRREGSLALLQPEQVLAVSSAPPFRHFSRTVWAQII
jgi:AAA family ATP:ADP antiporter